MKRPRDGYESAMATKAKKWSQHVTETSDAMDVEPGTFKLRSAKKIAEAVEHDAEKVDAKERVELSRGDVDADVLHQSCGQEPPGIATQGVGKREGSPTQRIRTRCEADTEAEAQTEA